MRRSWMGLIALLVGVLAWNAAQSEEEKPNPGKELFLSNKCNSCHMVSKEGIEKKSSATAASASAEKGEASDDGEADDAAAAKSKKSKYPDLSGVGLAHDAAWMTKYLQKVEAKDGKKHMKKFRGTDEELGVLTAWLASLKHEMKDGDAAAEKASDAKEASEAGAEKASDAGSKESEQK